MNVFQNRTVIKQNQRDGKWSLSFLFLVCIIFVLPFFLMTYIFFRVWVLTSIPYYLGTTSPQFFLTLTIVGGGGIICLVFYGFLELQSIDFKQKVESHQEAIPTMDIFIKKILFNEKWKIMFLLFVSILIYLPILFSIWIVFQSPTALLIPSVGFLGISDLSFATVRIFWERQKIRLKYE